MKLISRRTRASAGNPLEPHVQAHPQVFAAHRPDPVMAKKVVEDAVAACSETEWEPEEGDCLRRPGPRASDRPWSPGAGEVRRMLSHAWSGLTPTGSVVIRIRDTPDGIPIMGAPGGEGRQC